MKRFVLISILLIFAACKKEDNNIPQKQRVVMDTIPEIIDTRDFAELINLPILSEKLDTTGQMKRYTMAYSGFVNQDSMAFTNANLNGKVVIANFFFTRCPSICPPMRQQLIELSGQINHDDFLILSHTIDPENDTPSILKDYAIHTGIPNQRWQFLYAPEENTKALAHLYMTNFKPNKKGTDFYHSSYTALLDKNRLIRGFYNLLVPEDMERLKEDIDLIFSVENK